LHATVALISVGANNGYGHPTKRALDALAFAQTEVYRTDLHGSVAVSAQHGALEVAVGGGG
jgi:competence protein ComEC